MKRKGKRAKQREKQNGNAKHKAVQVKLEETSDGNGNEPKIKQHTKPDSQAQHRTAQHEKTQNTSEEKRREDSRI